MSKRTAKTYLIWLYDRDKKEFTFTGPVSDDTYWTNRISELQRQGRNVNCSTSDSTVNVEAEKRAYASTHGYTFNDALKF